jgi:hypothetical protein
MAARQQRIEREESLQAAAEQAAEQEKQEARVARERQRQLAVAEDLRDAERLALRMQEHSRTEEFAEEDAMLARIRAQRAEDAAAEQSMRARLAAIQARAMVRDAL